MKTYIALHIGLNLPGNVGPSVPKEAVVEFLMGQFESFTVIDALGVFHGEREPALVVGIAATDPQRVIKVAADLRTHFGWEGVGVVINGKYDRVTADATPSVL